MHHSFLVVDLIKANIESIRMLPCGQSQVCCAKHTEEGSDADIPHGCVNSALLGQELHTEVVAYGRLFLANQLIGLTLTLSERVMWYS
jgi:hypothetical protein